jgi:ribosomal protein S18 acetylase RimI-like enzyme
MPDTRPGILIRPAVLDDAPAIASVIADAFAEYQAAYTPAAFAATTPGRDQIQKRLREGPIWVALHHDRVVGTVSAVPQGAALYIRSMAVAPGARGLGFGRLLLAEVERFAAAHSYTSLVLSTTPFLARAIQLYERYGFRLSSAGPQELFGTALLTMVKPVAPGLLPL